MSGYPPDPFPASRNSHRSGNTGRTCLCYPVTVRKTVRKKPSHSKPYCVPPPKRRRYPLAQQFSMAGLRCNRFGVPHIYLLVDYDRSMNEKCQCGTAYIVSAEVIRA